MIEIAYQEHPEFELDGQNVIYTLTVMPWQGADSGMRLRLKGRGMPSKTHKGDQLVDIEVSAPAAVTEEQKALYARMAELYRAD